MALDPFSFGDDIKCNEEIDKELLHETFIKIVTQVASVAYVQKQSSLRSRECLKMEN